jgi:hypothetical protein
MAYPNHPACRYRQGGAVPERRRARAVDGVDILRTLGVERADTKRPAGQAGRSWVTIISGVEHVDEDTTGVAIPTSGRPQPS